MAGINPTFAVLAYFLVVRRAANAEVFSDLITPVADQGRALEIKSQEFWQPVLQASEKAKSIDHSTLFVDTEAAIAALPKENEYVRQALSDALSNLQRADAMVAVQGAESSELAAERLAAPVTSTWENPFSFLTGGQNYFSLAIRHFIGGGQYSERLENHVHARQSDILPALRGAAAASGNVLKDCRIASRRSFDVLQYDIYNNGVPKTPGAAKAVANRLVDAAGETRHHFMSFVTEAVQGITRDTERKYDDPSATVTQSLMGVDEQLKRIDSMERAGTGLRLAV